MKTKVLLVDDEEDIRHLLEQAFSTSGCEVHSAAFGAEAKHKAMEWLPDVVVCDYQLQDMDGLTLITDLQRELPHCKYVLLTSMLFDSATSKELADRHSLKYLPKTTPLRQVLNEVIQLLD